MAEINPGRRPSKAQTRPRRGEKDGRFPAGFPDYRRMPARVPLSRRLRPYLPAFGILLLGLGVGYLGWLWYARSERQRDARHFEEEVGRMFEVLHTRMEQHELLLAKLAMVFAGPRDNYDAGWTEKITEADPSKDSPDLAEIAYAECSPAGTEPPAAEAQPAGTAPTRNWTVTFAYIPSQCSTNDSVWDTMRDPDLVALAEQALAADRTAISGLRELTTVYLGRAGRGVTLMVPVYDTRPPGNNTNAVRPRPRGVVFGSIESHIMLDRLFGATPRGVEVEVFTAAEPTVANWVNPRADAPSFLAPGPAPYLKTSFPYSVYGKPWRFIFYTSPYFERGARGLPSPHFWFIGLLLAGSLALVAVGQIRLRLAEAAAAAELREALSALRAARDERERLSRDLHDGTIQSLFGVRLGLGREVGELRASWPDMARKIQDQLGQLDDVIGELRRFLVTADPLPREHANLASILRLHCEQLRRGLSREVTFESEGSWNGELTPRQTIELASIAREALSNSLRHANARQIHLRLAALPGQAELTVHDDGIGFDPRTVTRGQGLANMESRATEIGAQLKLDSAPGRGTTLTVRLPVPHPA